MRHSKNYCDNSLESYISREKYLIQGVSILDSIINYKAAVAETFDIKFEIKLMIPRDLKWKQRYLYLSWKFVG